MSALNPVIEVSISTLVDWIWNSIIKENFFNALNVDAATGRELVTCVCACVCALKDNSIVCFHICQLHGPDKTYTYVSCR